MDSPVAAPGHFPLLAGSSWATATQVATILLAKVTALCLACGPSSFGLGPCCGQTSFKAETEPHQFQSKWLTGCGVCLVGSGSLPWPRPVLHSTHSTQHTALPSQRHVPLPTTANTPCIQTSPTALTKPLPDNGRIGGDGTDILQTTDRSHSSFGDTAKPWGWQTFNPLWVWRKISEHVPWDQP